MPAAAVVVVSAVLRAAADRLIDAGCWLRGRRRLASPGDLAAQPADKSQPPIAQLSAHPADAGHDRVVVVLERAVEQGRGERHEQDDAGRDGDGFSNDDRIEGDLCRVGHGRGEALNDRRQARRRQERLLRISLRLTGRDVDRPREPDTVVEREVAGAGVRERGAVHDKVDVRVDAFHVAAARRQRLELLDPGTWVLGDDARGRAVVDPSEAGVRLLEITVAGTVERSRLGHWTTVGDLDVGPVLLRSEHVAIGLLDAQPGPCCIYRRDDAQRVGGRATAGHGRLADARPRRDAYGEAAGRDIGRSVQAALPLAPDELVGSVGEKNS